MAGLTLEVAGELAEYDSAPLVAAALGGILETHTEERVNVVNAPSLAKARGINLAVHKIPEAGRYSSLLTLRGERSVAGTVAVGRVAPGGPRRLRGRPGAHRRTCSSPDTRTAPAPSALVGQALGEADVNISAMHLGRSDKRSIAFMILALDEPVPEAAAERIRSFEAMLDVWLISLDAPG